MQICCFWNHPPELDSPTQTPHPISKTPATNEPLKMLLFSLSVGCPDSHSTNTENSTSPGRVMLVNPPGTNLIFSIHSQTTEKSNLFAVILLATGHYVPQLAKKIVDYNKANSHSFINLKGFIVRTENCTTLVYWKYYNNFLKMAGGKCSDRYKL